MSNLKINRDKKEPNDSELLKHKNFDEVLKKSGVSAASGSSYTVWIITSSVAIVACVAIFFFSTDGKLTDNNVPVKNNPKLINQPSIGETNREEKSINKIAIVKNNTIKNTDSISNIPNDETVNVETNITPDEKEVEKPTILIEQPILASGKVFSLSSEFKLLDEFPSLAIYENVKFQPIDNTINESYLETSWDDAKLDLVEGRYMLKLTLRENSKTFEVQPVFLQKDFEKAKKTFSP